MPELQLRHRVDDVVRTAVRAALPSTVQNGQTHTADLFAAIAEADVHGRWERFWLACGYPTLSRIRAAADPADATDSEFRRWQGLFLTSYAGRALNLADVLCATYDRDEIDVGLLALALVGDPGAGAATVLLDGSGSTHEDLLTVVQSELVGSDLADLHTVLAEFRDDPTPAGPRLRPRASTVQAAEDLLEPPQPRRTPPDGAASSRPSDVVAVLASPADHPIAATVSRWLTDEGATVVDSGSTGVPTSSAVVLASHAAVADPAWHTAAENLQCDRLIPVRIDDVPAESLPPAVAQWNWVEWSDDDVRNRTAISIALCNDIDDFRATKALQSEAEVWDRAGRPAYLLISSSPRIRAAQRHLSATEDATPATETVRSYLQASIKGHRRQVRNRWGRWLYRGVAVAVAAVAVVVVAVNLRSAGRSSDTAAMGMSGLGMIDNRPDRLAMLTAATILRPGYGDPEPARFMLAETLARPWAAGYLGADHPARLATAVFTADEQRALTLDGDGFLTAWDTRALRALWRHSAVDQQPVGLLDADPAGTTVVIATAGAMHVVNVETWERGTTPLPAAPTDFALAPADGYVAVAAGQLLLVDAAGGRAIPAPIQGHVLALQQTAAGHVLALIRQGDIIVLADPRTGAVTARTNRIGHPFEFAAIGRDGAVAWTGPDRQLYVASSDLELTATGQAVPDVVELLQPLSAGRVAFGGAQFGVRIYDHHAHAEVGQICLASLGGGTTDLAVSPAEDLVGCIDHFGVELWRTRDLSPNTDTGPAPAGRTPHAVASWFDVDGSDEGVLTFSTHPTPEHPDRVDVRTVVDDSAVTALAAGDRWIIAGTANGTVAQYSLGPEGALHAGRWTAPGGTPVTGVGQDPDDELSILVETAGGLRWRLPSCLLCVDDVVLIERVKKRLWGCYTENQLERIHQESRDRLGVTICAPAPKPAG